jgi:hypothetical protein
MDNDIKFWKSCGQYSVVQAALLIVGCDPDKFGVQLEEPKLESLPKGYIAVRTALCNAIVSDRLHAIVRAEWYDKDLDLRTLDPTRTLIEACELNDFVKSNNIECKFFERGVSPYQELLSPDSRFYPPKLLAAMAAWREVTADPKLLKGKSPKAALEAWLTLHAAEHGLLKEDGRPNRQAIEDIAKVANWQAKGGAPSTLGA